MEIDRTGSPVFITGIPRSGTSMIAGVLQICGAFLGGTPKPEKQSPRGMYENKKIHDRLVEPFLLGLGADPFCQFPLPRMDSLHIPIDWRDRVVGVLEEEGFPLGACWAYKSNKSCLIWPVWDFAFPNAKWIIVRRRTGDIINSCLSTMYMKAFKDPSNLKEIGVSSEEEGWKWMAHQYESHFIGMMEKGLNCKVIWPDRMINGDYSQLYEMMDWVGLKWSSKIFAEALAYIDPKFWKVRRE